MITIEFRGIDRMVKDLRKMRQKAIPHAVRNALNTMAFEARSIWRQELRETFTLRNQFTTRSILVTKATGIDARRMVAVVGSTTDYLDEQEEGGTVRGTGAHKNIPGAAAAGQAPGAKRTKLVQRSKWIARIKAIKGTRGGPKQRNAAALAMAARKKGQQVVLLERPGGGQGLFQVSGGQRTFSKRKGAGRKKIKMRMLWDMSRSSVRVPRQPTLQRSLKKLSPKVEHIMRAALIEQLRRGNIAGY